MIRKVMRHGFKGSCFIILTRYVMKIKVVFYKYFLSDNKLYGIQPKILLPTQFIGKGKIEINQATIGVWPSAGFFDTSNYIEARSSTAKVIIEAGTHINNHAIIVADRTQISIGKNCLIGPNVFITDSDFHGLRVEDRTNGNYDCKPVLIGDNVFIGEGVRVLKGVKIGEGAVIACASLVVKDVAANTIVGGIPAKEIGNLN